MTYGWQNMPTTPDIDAYRQSVTQDAGADPAIQYHYARRRGDIDRSYNNPFGAEYSPEMRDAITRGQKSELDQEHGAALSADAFRRRQLKQQQLYQLAGLTSPRMVQTGGSTTGTVSQPLWPGIIAGGIQAGMGI